MNLSKCCKCSYTRCRCDTVKSTTLVPIIEKKKKAVVTKPCNKPEPSILYTAKIPFRIAYINTHFLSFDLYFNTIKKICVNLCDLCAIIFKTSLVDIIDYTKPNCSK